MRARLQVLVLAAALGATVVPGAAAAADNKKSIPQQFSTAQDLHDKGRCDEALPMFRELFSATESPNARLYVARCLRNLGRLPEAYDEMSATLREATTRADSEAKYAGTRDAAATELALLERRIGKLIIAVANPPPGVEVSLDDTALPASRVGTPVAVRPGLRTVIVTAPGRDPVQREVNLSAGETKTVAVALKNEDEQGGLPPPPPAPDEPQRSGGGARIAGYVVAGLGVAGLGMFGVTGMMANSRFKTLEDECGGVRCTDPRYADTIDQGKTLDLLANIGLIAGASALTIGTAMIIFGGPSDADDSAPEDGRAPKPRRTAGTTAAGVSITPQGASARLAITF